MSELVVKLVGLMTCFFIGALLLKIYDFIRPKALKHSRRTSETGRIATHPRRDLLTILFITHMCVMIITGLVCFSGEFDVHGVTDWYQNRRMRVGYYVYLCCIFLGLIVHSILAVKRINQYVPHKLQVDKRTDLQHNMMKD